MKLKISKGDTQFVKAFFPIKAIKRAFEALHTIKFRMMVLSRLDRLEQAVKKLEREKK